MRSAHRGGTSRSSDWCRSMRPKYEIRLATSGNDESGQEQSIFGAEHDIGLNVWGYIVGPDQSTSTVSAALCPTFDAAPVTRTWRW